MKKAMIPMMSALLVAALFTGCRRNVATETKHPTNTTNHTTGTHATVPSTHAATRPTETTRHTEPSHSTYPSQMPSILPDTTDSTGASGHGRVMPPRY